MVGQTVYSIGITVHHYTTTGWKFGCDRVYSARSASYRMVSEKIYDMHAQRYGMAKHDETDTL
jgi:hypothetical protein